MKRLLYLLFLLISTTTFGQTEKFIYDSLSRTAKFYDDSGHVTCKIVHLDKEADKHQHFITYNKNGQKTEEFFSKNGVVYDTLKRWTDKGELHHIEIYTDSGYTAIDYWYETGHILEIGKYKVAKVPPDNFTIYDSTTFDIFTTIKCNNDKPCYVRTGIWKEYYKNGTLESEGQYLPTAFEGIIQTKDSSGIGVPVKKTSFEMVSDVTYLTVLTYLKNGTWKYYDEKGLKTKEEFYKGGHLKK